MKRFLIMLCVSIIGTFLIGLLGVNFTDKLSPILFTVCGILFSVALSQLISFNISEVKNKEVYDKMIRSIKLTRNSMVMQFNYTCVAYLLLEIIKEKPIINLSIVIGKLELSLDKFSNIILIYCVFYFLNLFSELSEKKLNLDGIIREESLEE